MEERDALKKKVDILRLARDPITGDGYIGLADVRPGETVEEALKRAEAELAQAQRQAGGKQWKYYAADNEEQLDRLGREPGARELYERAGTAGEPDVVIRRVLSALERGGSVEDDPAAVAQIRERFGVSPEKSGSAAQYMNDLTALLGTDLGERDVQAEAIGALERRGYDYNRISGYERTRREAEEYARKQGERQEAAREHPVLSSAVSVLASPLQGLDFLDTALRGLGPNNDEKDLDRYVPMDPYGMEATNLVNTLRGTVAAEIEKNTDWEIAGQNVASFLYQTGMSVLDSAAQIAAFGPAATYFMGASAAANQVQDIMARGGTNRQALLGGLAAGAAEAVFEKFSIDNLLSAKTVGGAKDLLWETLKQAGVEASEEMFTEVANILSDAAVMGGSSNFNLAVQDYLAQGMSGEEARRRAYLDMVGQVAWAGAGGALSGGVMGGVVNAGNYVRQNVVLPGGRITSQDAVNSVNDRLSQPGQVAQDMGAVFLPGSGLDAGTEGPYNGAKEAVSYGRGEEAIAGLQGVFGADVRGENRGPEAIDAGIPRGGDSENGGVQEAPGRGGGTGARLPGWAEGHVVEKASTPGTVRAQEAASSFIDGVVVISDAALKGQHEGAWAITSGGTVLLSDKIPAELAAPVGYHEVVHAVRQRGSEVYRTFLSRLDDRVNFSADRAVYVLDTVVKSRFAGKDLMELNDVELKTVYDELNALVWGYYKADPEKAKAEFGDVFTDYDGYIAELDAIMEGARAAESSGPAAQGKFLPGAGEQQEGAADEARWDSILGEDALPELDSGREGYWDGLTGDVRGLPTAEEAGSGADSRTGREKAMWEEARRGAAAAGDGEAGYRGTPATDKLGIKVERPITDLGQSQSIRGLEKARYQAVQELNRVLKESHATQGERAFAQGIADGVYSIRQAPPGMSVETIQSVADAIWLRDSLGGKTKDAKARTNWGFDSVVRQLTRDSDNWTAPGVLSLNANTMQRNVERMVGGEAAKALNAEFFDPVVANEAERIRFVNRMLERMEGFRLNAGESGMVQMLMEGKVTEGELKAQGYDAGRLAGAAKTLSGMYADFYEAINDFLAAHGYREIGWQKNYAPHMQEDNVNTLQRYLQRLGFQMQVTELPTELAGRTDAFRPGKQYDPYFQHRRGSKTVYNAVGGLESYVNYLSNVFYHTDDIQKLRRLSEGLRTKYSAEELGAELDRLNRLQDRLVLEDAELLGEDSIQDLKEKAYERFGKMTKLGGFVSVLDDYTNILAGKQSKFDRAVESLIGRTGLNWGRNIQNAFARAAIVGNLSSAVNQTVQIPQLVAEVGPKYTVQAVIDVATGVTGKTGFNQESDFITGKRGVQSISEKTGSERFFDLAAKPFEVVDDFASRVIVRAKYLEQVAQGQSHEAALRAADQFASRLVGSRMKGAKPVLFEQKNPLSKLVTTFQLEVANGWEHIVHDLPMEIREIAQAKGKPAAVKRTAELVVASQVAAFIGNVIIKSLTGREPVPFDGMGMLLNYLASGYGMTKEEYMAAVADNAAEAAAGKRPLGTERPGGAFDTPKALKSAAEDAGEDIPYLSNITSMLGLTDGRLPMPQVWNSQLTRGAKGLMTAGELEDETEREEAVRQGLAGMGSGAADLLATWLPMGSQLKKTARGAEALARGGAYVGYGDNEALQYPIEGTPANWTRGLLFGKSALPETDAYYAQGAKKLSVGQTDVYRQLVESGADGGGAYETIQDIRGEKKTDGKLSVLRAADLTDEQKMILYRGMVSDSRDEDIAAAAGAGISFDDFLDAHGAYYEIREREDMTAGERTVEFARWLNGRGYSKQQYDALREAFTFYSQVPTGETAYEKFVGAGMPDNIAYQVAGQIRGLEPLPGKTQVSTLQKSRVIVDCGADEPQKLAALAVVMDDGEYIKTETAYEYGVSTAVYVTFKEQVEGLTKQEDVERVLDRLMLTREQKAALWQLQNTGWKPYKNPFSTTISREIIETYSSKKEDAKNASGPPTSQGSEASVKNWLPTYEEFMARMNG